MKKVFLTLAVIATVACLSSCNKKCACKTYVAGVVINTTEDIEIDKGKKCADYTVIAVQDPKTGTECSTDF